MFAQGDQQPPIAPQVEPELPVLLDAPWYWWHSVPSMFLSAAYLALLVWMLVECLRKDPDRYLWMWVILVFHPLGPFLYLILRWLPHNQFQMPEALRRWTRGRELKRLETAAAQIGNAYHHIQLGDALRETGHNQRAAAAYSAALEKEPDNTQALWGAALVDMDTKSYDCALGRLRKLLDIDPQYKFGDVSLAYGRTLYELDRIDEAGDHLQKHIKRWRHPEGLYLMALVASQQGHPDVARTHLEAMLLDINGSPRAIARKQGAWKSRARRLLRKLP